jgi:hypothetical protein
MPEKQAKANGNGADKKDLTNVAQIAAAASAVVAVVTSLAVTGVLAKAQRDQGVKLVIAFGFVLLGAVLWLIATVMPATPQEGAGSKRWDDWKARKWRKWVLFPWTGVLFLWSRWQPLSRQAKVQIVSGGLFAVGLLIAIWALVSTQQDAERPAISASFHQKTSVLEATVTAVGLHASDRIEIRVDGLMEKKKQEKRGRGPVDVYYLVADPRVLYQAVLGPDGDGKVSEAVTVQVPQRDRLVGIKAWTGKADVGCYFGSYANAVPEAHRVPQKYRDACVILRLIHSPAP